MTTPSIDGTVTGTVGFNNSSKSVTLTTTAAGIVVVYVSNESNLAQVVNQRVQSVSGGSLTWKRRWQNSCHLAGGDNFRNHEVWWATSSGALSAASITVTMDGNVDGCAIVAFGVKNCTGFDPNLQLPQVCTDATTLTYNSDNADSLVLVFENGNLSGGTPTGGGGGPSTFTSVAGTRDSTGFGNAGAAVYSASATSAISAGTVAAVSGYNMMVDVLTNDSATAHNAPTLDGSNYAQINNGTNSIARPLTTTAAGEVICLVFTDNNSSGGVSATVSGVTATGLTFTKRSTVTEKGSSGSGNQGDVEIWTAPSTGAFSNKTITASLNANADSGFFAVLGIAGANSTTPFDTASLPVFENTGGNVTVSTNNADDILIWVSNAISNTGYSGIPAGFAQLARDGDNGGFQGVGYQVAIKRVNATLSSTTITASSAGTNVINMVDALQAPVTSFNVSITESGSASDTVQESLGEKGGITEFGNAVDTVSQRIIYNPHISESGSATDHPSATEFTDVSISETLHAQDAVGPLHNMIVPETLHAADTVVFHKVINLGISERGHAADSIPGGGAPHIVETLDAAESVRMEIDGVYRFLMSDILDATDTVTEHNNYHLAIAETGHAQELVRESVNGIINLTVGEHAPLDERFVPHIRTDSVIIESLDGTDRFSAALIVDGTLNLSISETGNLHDHLGQAQTFVDPGIYFWNYKWAYDAGFTSLTCQIAGLDCGEHAVAPAGYVFVPWLSDPDRLFTPAYLLALSANPPENGFGATACNIDLYNNVDQILRVTVDVSIGLTYRSQVQLLRPNMQEQIHSQYGPSIGETRRISSYAAQLVNAGGLGVGTTQTNIRPVTFTQPNGLKYLKSQLYSGIWWQLVDDQYDFDGQLLAQVERPYSFTLAALTAYLKTFDRE